jgi:putative flippase GtrA
LSKNTTRHIIKSKQTLARFIVVGLINTALDFGILLVLTHFGLDKLVANVISSTIAFVFSFFANKKYTFQTTDTNVAREMLLFVIVTLTGLWVLQTFVIWLTTPLAVTILHNTSVALVASKLIATVVSMTWNYVLYSKLVFKKH